jgi:hypothetical protein
MTAGGAHVKTRKFFAVIWCATALLFLSVSNAGVRAIGCLPLPSPWTAADVGDVGIVGNTCVDADGTPWTVSGAGADIWGTADAFQFAYRSFAADGSITVKLSGEHDTDPFAKAGIMIRQTLAPDSAHVILDVKPDGGIEFMTRPAGGASTTFIAGASTPLLSSPPGVSSFYVNLKLERSGDLVTASVLQGGSSTWTVVGSTTWASGPALIGMAVTSHNTSTLNSAPFDIPSVLTLPAPWNDSDVGDVGQPGTASFTDNTFTVRGAGADIWDTSDSFNFLSQAVTQDVEIVARVVSEDNTDTFAKAGVMMRGPMHGPADPSAPAVILDVKPDGGIEFMARAGEAEALSFLAGSSVPMPTWLKLVRSQDTFTAFVSADGQAWSLVGTVDVPLSTGFQYYYVGLAVTSHDPGVLNTAAFDNVRVDTTR